MVNRNSVADGRCDRRQMLRVAACGFGSLALQGMISGLARGGREPACGPLASLRSSRQARDLPVHPGRSVAARPV